jgi:metal-responsive CopG/Arc/MetJ family transcriptional regulator
MKLKAVEDKFVIMQTYLKPAVLKTMSDWSKKMKISRAQLVRLALEEFIAKYHHKMENQDGSNPNT